MPRHRPPHQVRHAPRWVQPTPRHHPHPVVRKPVFQLPNHKTVNRIFAHLPTHPDRRRHHMVHHSLLRPPRLNRSNRCLAERSNLELRTVSERVSGRPQSALPVSPRRPKLHPSIARVVLRKNETAHRPFHRMANVVDEGNIPVRPTRKASHAVRVVPKEGPPQSSPGARLGRQPKPVLDPNKQGGLAKQGLPRNRIGP